MKTRILTIVLICVVLLLGCSSGKVNLSKATESIVGINSDGTVEEVVVESFEQNYYSMDDMTTFIAEVVEDFNEKHPLEMTGANKDQEEHAAVIVHSINRDENNHTVYMSMSYNDVATYSEFNGVNLSYCTLDEALSGGVIEADQKLISVKNQAEASIGDIGDVKNTYVVMADTAMRIQTAGKIAYYSEGAEVQDKNIVQTTDEQTIIIFK